MARRKPIPEAFVAGRADGRAAAERDLAARCPASLTVGLRDHDEDALDRTVWLPRRSIGCEISDETMGYLAGYWEVLQAAIDAGIVEPMCLRRKATTREGLAERFRADPGLLLDEPTELDLGAPVAALRLEVIIDAPEPKRGWVSPPPIGLRLGAPGGAAWRLTGFPSAPSVLFEDDGTTLLVRYRAFPLLHAGEESPEEAWSYAVYDLPTRVRVERFEGWTSRRA